MVIIKYLLKEEPTPEFCSYHAVILLVRRATENEIWPVKTILLTDVPQRSVLDSLFFLIYINDLNICIKSSKTYPFAKILVLHKQINHLRT